MKVYSTDHRTDAVQSTHPTELALSHLIKRATIDTSFAFRPEELHQTLVGEAIANCDNVLDVGRSSRLRKEQFKGTQVTTLDITKYSDYPDIVDDLCNPEHLENDRYDGVICISVLEHVYDPFAAVKTLRGAMKPGGIFIGYTPFLFRYHGPKSLAFKDYYRFSRDGLCYLFRDFSDLRLYTVRGQLTTAMNLFRWWKRGFEKRCPTLAFGLDRLLTKQPEELQVSGYYIRATK